MQKVLPGLPADVGMAFVVVQHMAPKYHSALPSLLAKYTDMPIETITDGVQVQPDTVYITPPNNNVTFSDNRLMLSAGPAIGPKPSIDAFFKSLAEEKMAHAVGIILSGTGSDGAHGIWAIKSNEGITMAQSTDSAKFDGMPRAAIETGFVDMVLPPEKIGEGLQAALQYPNLLIKEPTGKHLDEIGTILDMIQQQTGIDYSEYKKNTIYRRISRRMAIHKLESTAEYIGFIKCDPQELDALSKDMLIYINAELQEKLLSLFHFSLEPKSSTEELQSLNEELQAANEELQTTNEELETSNEELQASNEELNTVNDEPRAKSDEAAELLESLTVGERRYRRLVDNMNEALMLCEIEHGLDKEPTDLIIQQANRTFENLMAIKSRDLPMRAGAARMQELVSRDMLDQFEVIAKGGDSRRIELGLAAVGKDLTLSVYNMGNDRLGMVCRDDTERKRVETALRQSEIRYRTIGEAIPYGVLGRRCGGQLHLCQRHISGHGRHDH